MKSSSILLPFLGLILSGCARTTPEVQLAEAILKDDPDAVTQAVQAGAQVNTPFQFKDQHTSTELMVTQAQNSSPLILATRQGRAKAVQALLKAGADPNGIDGQTGDLPLHMVTSIEVAEALVAGGADVNRPTPGQEYNRIGYKSTPLMIATAQGKRDLAEFFLKHGAKVQARDADGNTAWRYTNLYRPDMRRLLLSYGAKPNDSGPPPAQLQAIAERRKREQKQREAEEDRSFQAQIQKEDEAIDKLEQQQKR